MSRFVITNAGSQSEATAQELAAYLATDVAPANATTAHARAIARMFSDRPVMRDLADGKTVDVDTLIPVAAGILDQVVPASLTARSFQALMNWVMVGAARVEEID